MSEGLCDFGPYPQPYPHQLDAVWRADPRYFDLLSELHHVSPGMSPVVARFSTDSAGGRISDWQSVNVIEISATNSPALKGTSFRVTAPERVPAGEYHYITAEADRFSYSSAT